MRLVIDGSVAVSWFLADEQSQHTQEVKIQISAAELVAVPAHWPLEVANALLVAERRNRIAPGDVNHALALLRQMPVRVDRETDAHAGTQRLELARRHTLSIYDAAYLELALRLGAKLASLDEPLRSAARARGVPVI